ncbi:MAG: aminopeptidase P family protein [Prevotella sp.]|nr:aminopeptidase P family protein [Prevotella sp.]
MNYDLNILRQEMRTEKIDAVIFPTSDPHNSEYLPEHWQTRQWITGFTGSAGTAVVTLDEAALWTDSRYFIQAEMELRSSSRSQSELVQGSSNASLVQNGGFVLMKEGLPETPTITEWLLRKMSVANGRVVAVDGMVINYSEAMQMGKELRKIGVTLRTDYDIAKRLWTNRPAIPSNPIYGVEREWIGESVGSKLHRIREVMREQHCDAHILTDLMGIAWTLNLRGSDVKMTPVFISNLLITLDDATLFADGMLNADAKALLYEANVNVKPYGEFLSTIAKTDGRVLIDPQTTSYSIYNKVKEHAVEAPSPVIAFKAVKNQKEIEGFHKSMVLDGIAMVRFLRWLKPAVEQGGQTEISVSDKLEQLRRESTECLDLSFSTICGYNAHGAIVHYMATPETDAPLKPEGLLLIDSGAQYTCGTTDITRTIALGPVTDEMRHAYTCVLKANIALATTPFPDGTCGTQIDAIARSEVWKGGYNYMHGTGHGVGWRLCVHEGPHRIHQQWFPAPLHPGMVVTDEPGIYLEGKFGIRTENVMIINGNGNVNVNGLRACSPEHQLERKNGNQTMNYELCTMNSLTLCPIDTAPIDFSMLTTKEVEWLNQYHKRVRETLLTHLSDEADKQWLIEATKEIGDTERDK